MTTILTQFELLARLSKDRLHESWIGKNRQPDYDQLPIVFAVSFPAAIAGAPSVQAVLDYELQLATQIHHRNIERTLAAGKEGEAAWFAKEVIPRESLRDFFDELKRRGYETLTIPLAISLTSVAAEALHFAHSAKNAAGWSLKAVHGGIDFHSLGLTYDGEVIVQGFGVAKALRQAHLGNAGALSFDRLIYLSPEEVRGRPAEARSDVFSLGLVLWELLTGRPLFNPNGDVFKAICDQPIQPPSAYNAKVTPGLDALVMRALERNPDGRFQNAEHMSVALRKLAGDPSKALERVPRILSQLFPERLEAWKSIEALAKSGDFGEVGVKALFLFQAGEATSDAPRFDADEDTVDSHTDRLDPEKALAFAKDVDAALGSLEGQNEVAGWDSAPLGEAAGKLSGLWDDAIAEEATIQTSAAEVAALVAASAPSQDVTQLVSMPTNPAETTLPVHEIPPEVHWDDGDMAQTLPTGTPSLQASEPDLRPAISPKVEQDPAVTAMSYKPQKMADSPPESVDSDPDAPSSIQVDQSLVETTPPSEVGAVASAPEPETYYPTIQPEFLPLDDDDDEDAEPFFEPFPLDLIVEPPELAPKESSTKPVLEIIRTSQGNPLDISVLRGALARYKVPNSSFSASKSGGSATLKFKEPVKGWLRLANKPKEDLGDVKKLSLKPGDAVQFEDQGRTYHVRFFRPPQPPARDQRLVSPQQLKIYALAFAISLVLHGLGMLGAILTQKFGMMDLTVDRPDEVEVFAEGKLDKPKPKKKPKPKPKPKKKKPKPPSEKPPDPTEAQAKIPKSVRKALNRRLKRTSSKNEDKADRLLSALTTPQKGDGKTLEDVVTNIDAVSRPGASNAVFNVTGTLKGLPGGQVNIARTPGGSKIGDIGGSVDGGTGKLNKRAKSGKVRGKARGVKALAKVRGSLTKGQVWDVINRNMGRIQNCYEKELNKNNSLAGKLTFEWTVKTNGKVGSVKEKGNTLGSKKVSKCVGSVIKKMKFPRPKGGEVIIKFPFIFKSG